VPSADSVRAAETAATMAIAQPAAGLSRLRRELDPCRTGTVLVRRTGFVRTLARRRHPALEPQVAVARHSTLAYAATDTRHHGLKLPAERNRLSRDNREKIRLIAGSVQELRLRP